MPYTESAITSFLRLVLGELGLDQELLRGQRRHHEHQAEVVAVRGERARHRVHGRLRRLGERQRGEQGERREREALGVGGVRHRQGLGLGVDFRSGARTGGAGRGADGDGAGADLGEGHARGEGESGVERDGGHGDSGDN
jgi:hypothetical protein